MDTLPCHDWFIDEIAVVADTRAGKDIDRVRPITPGWRRNSPGPGLLHQRIPALSPGPPAVMPEQIDAVTGFVAHHGENRTTQRRIKLITNRGPNAPEFHERIGIAQLLVGVDIRPGKDRRSDPRAPRLEAEK